MKFFILLIMWLFSLPIMAAENYKLDSDHSYVLWHISHFDFSNPSGKWMVQGTLQLDEAKPQDSKINVTIPIADMITGINKLDKHLKGEIFFNVAQFPTATFVSDKVDVTGKNTANVHGILTVRGISKPITLVVKLNKIGMSPITNKKTVGFSAHTILHRSDFGITTLLPGLSNEVKINIEAEAYKVG
jgi:polyisoprenoid-binding protein YceI